METLTEFVIPFVGLKEGKHDFTFDLDTTFFNAFEFNDFHHVSLSVDLIFEKTPRHMELHFSTRGTVGLLCDLTNEKFDFPLDTALDWIIKFGDEYNDDNDECLILPHGSFKVNVAQPIYEMTVLAVPLKKVHPGVADGTLDSELLKRLEELQPQAEKTTDNDPRWDKLKDLL